MTKPNFHLKLKVSPGNGDQWTRLFCILKPRAHRHSDWFLGDEAVAYHVSEKNLEAVLASVLHQAHLLPLVPYYIVFRNHDENRNYTIRPESCPAFPTATILNCETSAPRSRKLHYTIYTILSSTLLSKVLLCASRAHTTGGGRKDTGPSQKFRQGNDSL
jgi:hypothetical protein